MLVYYKVPRGILYVPGFGRIYGEWTNMPPADVPFEFWKIYKNCLEYATYREEYFKEKFGTHIDPIAFKYNELLYLPRKTLLRIAKAVKIDRYYFKRHTRLVHWIQKKLRDVI